jgi:N-methylhydantoinase A/oxoprolinase/acetone carboxylase beta subunit
VECFYLTASVETADLLVDPGELKGPEPPDAARLPSRKATWSRKEGAVETQVFSFGELEPGNVIIGPALIEAPDTTYVIEPEWRFTLDGYRNGILERIEEAS